MNKLEGLTSVRYITLEDDHTRQELLTKQFQQYNITPIPIKSKRFDESDDVITGKHVNQLTDPVKGCTVSHLKAFKDWYYNTDEPVKFIHIITQKKPLSGLEKRYFKNYGIFPVGIGSGGSGGVGSVTVTMARSLCTDPAALLIVTK